MNLKVIQDYLKTVHNTKAAKEPSRMWTWKVNVYDSTEAAQRIFQKDSAFLAAIWKYLEDKKLTDLYASYCVDGGLQLRFRSQLPEAEVRDYIGKFAATKEGEKYPTVFLAIVK